MQKKQIHRYSGQTHGYQWGEARGATQRWGIKRFKQLSIKQIIKIYHATWGNELYLIITVNGA